MVSTLRAGDGMTKNTTPIGGFLKNLNRADLEQFAQNCSAACSKKHFAAHGAIALIKQAIYELDRSKSNPEDNSQLVWNEQFDKIRRDLVYALDGLKEVT